MIRTFRDQQKKNIFRRGTVKGFPRNVQHAALRKLVILDAAESLDDLRVPPGNRPEKLKGRRKGEYSIRVNDQWRICFAWSAGDA
ncbi:MAG: type II toxin-antitoxin system RelE/ParE family toxin [Pirellulales bacterium]